jgi:hypothetical protein
VGIQILPSSPQSDLNVTPIPSSWASIRFIEA